MRQFTMNEKQLKELLENKKKLDERINFYLDHKIISKQSINDSEINGHIEKAEHNLNFVKDTLENGYSDWAVVGCYYATYHTATALILKKGFHSKNHDATLSILIKEYYKKELSEEDIELLNVMYLDNEDILFYVNSKGEREKASYSTQIVFDEEKVKDLRQKTISFIRKSISIIKSS